MFHQYSAFTQNNDSYAMKDIDRRSENSLIECVLANDEKDS